MNLYMRLPHCSRPLAQTCSDTISTNTSTHADSNIVHTRVALAPLAAPASQRLCACADHLNVHRQQGAHQLKRAQGSREVPGSTQEKEKGEMRGVQGVQVHMRRQQGAEPISNRPAGACNCMTHVNGCCHTLLLPHSFCRHSQRRVAQAGGRHWLRISVLNREVGVIRRQRLNVLCCVVLCSVVLVVLRCVVVCCGVLCCVVLCCAAWVPRVEVHAAN